MEARRDGGVLLARVPYAISLGALLDGAFTSPGAVPDGAWTPLLSERAAPEDVAAAAAWLARHGRWDPAQPAPATAEELHAEGDVHLDGDLGLQLDDGGHLPAGPGPCLVIGPRYARESQRVRLLERGLRMCADILLAPSAPGADSGLEAGPAVRIASAPGLSECAVRAGVLCCSHPFGSLVDPGRWTAMSRDEAAAFAARHLNWDGGLPLTRVLNAGGPAFEPEAVRDVERLLADIPAGPATAQARRPRQAPRPGVLRDQPAGRGCLSDWDSVRASAGAAAWMRARSCGAALHPALPPVLSRSAARRARMQLVAPASPFRPAGISQPG